MHIEFLKKLLLKVIEIYIIFNYYNVTCNYKINTNRSLLYLVILCLFLLILVTDYDMQ